MEAAKEYELTTYRPAVDQVAVFGCNPARADQGKRINCRLTFFTLRLGILFHCLTYKDVVMGSVFLKGLVAHLSDDSLVVQACDVSRIETIIKTKLFNRHDWIPWILRFLQFIHDHPKGSRDASPGGSIPFPDDLNPVLSTDRGIAELIDLHTVASFFGIFTLQRFVNHTLMHYLATSLKACFLVFSEGTMGTAQFGEHNISSQLRHAADAILRAAPIVPRESHIWLPVARCFLALRQVLDGTESGEEARQILARLNPVGPFAHAFLEESLKMRPAGLVGVFRSPVDWNLQCEVCACTACSNVIFARDLIARRADDLAGGAVQKYALVNPFDGYRTLFCDFCRQRCGVPWAGGNQPCVPHE